METWCGCTFHIDPQSQINGNATIMRSFTLLNLYCHFAVSETKRALQEGKSSTDFFKTKN